MNSDTFDFYEFKTKLQGKLVLMMLFFLVYWIWSIGLILDSVNIPDLGVSEAYNSIFYERDPYCNLRVKSIIILFYFMFLFFSIGLSQHIHNELDFIDDSMYPQLLVEVNLLKSLPFVTFSIVYVTLSYILSGEPILYYTPFLAVLFLGRKKEGLALSFILFSLFSYFASIDAFLVHCN